MAFSYVLNFPSPLAGEGSGVRGLSASRSSERLNNVLRRTIRCCTATLLIASSVHASAAAAADIYPSRPIRLVVPYTPGGGSDTVARIVSPKMADAVGKTVVVDNRAGAAGTLGTDLVATAPADGYTLLLADTPFTINTLHKNARYDARKTFVPVGLIATTPYVLVINPAVPAATLKDFVALAKAQPGKINLGSSGTGGGNHLTGELFKLRTGINLHHIPYKGAGPAIADVAGGQIQATFASAPGAVPGVKAGRLKPLAVTSAARSGALPDVPTLAEMGVKDLVIVNWYGIVAPAGTPHPAVQRLYAELGNAIALPDVRTRLANAALEPATPAPDQFRQLIDGEIKRWTQIIRDANIQLE